MTFAVIWALDAVRQLNLLVAAAAVPVTVQEAARWVDYALRRVPNDLGESREPGLRVWYGDVLGVYYHVDEAVMRVTVLAIGPARRRR
jgi:hypothetical protein